VSAGADRVSAWACEVCRRVQGYLIAAERFDAENGWLRHRRGRTSSARHIVGQTPGRARGGLAPFRHLVAAAGALPGTGSLPCSAWLAADNGVRRAAVGGGREGARRDGAGGTTDQERGSDRGLHPRRDGGDPGDPWPRRGSRRPVRRGVRRRASGPAPVGGDHRRDRPPSGRGPPVRADWDCPGLADTENAFA